MNAIFGEVEIDFPNAGYTLFGFVVRVMYAITQGGASKMTEQQNQQRQVSLETSSEPTASEKAATAEEFSVNVKSETVSQLLENSAQDRLKALGRLMMVSLTWSLAGLSKPK